MQRLIHIRTEPGVRIQLISVFSHNEEFEGASLFLFLYFIVDVLLNRIEKGDLLLC